MAIASRCGSGQALAVLVLALASCVGAIEPMTDRSGGQSADPPPPDRPSRPGGAGTKEPPVASPAALCPVRPARVRKLTPEQYGRTVRALLPDAVDVTDELRATAGPGKGQFSSDAGALDLSEPHVAALYQIAQAAAAKAARDPGRLASCLANAMPDPACWKAFIEGFVPRAYRRDVTPADVDGAVSFLKAQAAANDPATALRLFLTWVLMSPEFVFRTEIGSSESAAFERASALSYLLTDGPPDAELLAAARSRQLDSAAQLIGQARRLVATPAAGQGVIRFFRELLDYNEVRTVRKDAQLFKELTPALAADMAEESARFVENAVWQGDGRLETLLTSASTLLSGRLAAFYGVTGVPASAPFARVTPPPGRGGVLTQASLMARLAVDNDTAPVARGKFVREEVLCQHLPDPPPNVNAVPPPPDGKRTQRERLAVHSADPSCSGCHALIDPIGLAFESYDGIGRYRTADVGKQLDLGGVLTGVSAPRARFADGVDLAALLASSPEAGRCFVVQAFRYAAGRTETAADACVLDPLVRSFGESRGNVRELFAALASAGL